MNTAFLSSPFVKEDILMALEKGIGTVIVEKKYVSEVQNLARITVYALEDILYITLNEKADELHAIRSLEEGKFVVIRYGFEIIPLENIIARSLPVYVEVKTKEDIEVAKTILEHGVAGIILEAKTVELCEYANSSSIHFPLKKATILAIEHAGMGDRVCLDTTSLWQASQGMLLGNSAGFFFLVHAETEYNEYVAPRPFRVNAGSVHSYVLCVDDTTKYLSEVHAGDTLLACTAQGACSAVTVGRCKVERRPMLMITAECEGKKGIIFLQNAETICLVTAEGTAKSVVSLTIGESILVHIDTAGRHFGVRVSESIIE